MNCIIIDDEKPALELQEDNVRNVPFFNLLATGRNVLEAMDLLKKYSVDLIFLDIQMPR